MESLTSNLSIPIRSPIAGRWALAALLGFGLTLRLAYSLRLPQELLIPDAVSFDKIAWSLASEGRYALDGQPTAYRPPSYILFLAAIYKIAGHDYRAVRVAQAFVGLALILVLMQTAREMRWGSRTFWAAGVIAAFYPFFIYYESHLIADAYLAFWHATALLLFLRWVRQPTVRRAAFMGFAFALICLMKSIFLPLFGLIVLTELWIRARKEDPRALAKSLVAAILAFSFPMGVWVLRNEKVFGRFLLDGHGGRTLVETVVFHDRVKDGTFIALWKGHPLAKTTESMDEGARDAFYIAYVKRYIRENPVLYVRQSLSRFKDLWRFYPRPEVRLEEGRREAPQASGLQLIAVSLLTEPLLILAGLYGIWTSRHAWRELYPFYATLVFTTAAYSLITGQMRYRLPLMPVMILFASYALFSPKHRSSDH